MSTGPLHLSKIDLIAFRGIERTLPLEFGRRLTIIYGGNATGKSSIAQAIEFAMTGQVRDYEDGLIPAGYLANTRAGSPGRVSLTLDDGSVLTGSTDRPRSEIERRFREVGTVDWPERQPLPLTTTHVTTQGMLARVLGSANAVTRNDLSGLCAGAYLRFLVSRARTLADHFRQASSGRNIQAELRDARAAYDTAKLLRDSLVTTSQANEVSAAAVDARLRDVNVKLSLPGPTSVDASLVHMGKRLEEIEQRLQTLQSLLGRTRELGQREAEFEELKKQLSDARAAQSVVLENKTAVSAALLKTAEQLQDAVSRRTQLLDDMAAYEQHQQATSVIAALEERIRELRLSAQKANDDTQTLNRQLDAARGDLLARSAKLAQLRQSRQTAELQRNATQQAIEGITHLPSGRDPKLEAAAETLRRELLDLERAVEARSKEVQSAREEEAVISARLSEVSASGERFLAAVNEMRSFVADGHCPFCGQNHGSVEALEQAIGRISAASVHGADVLRRQFEAASEHRQASETEERQQGVRIAEARTNSSALLAAIQKMSEERKAATSVIEQNLRRAGLSVAFEAEVLKGIQADLDARISGLDQEIRDGSGGEREEEARRAQLERALAAKSSEVEQLGRLGAELSDQIGKVRANLGAGTTPHDHARNKDGLAEVEPLIRVLEREQGQRQASLLELDRTIAEKKSEIAGIERRLQVVEAFLGSLDAELKAVGASRDVRTVLEIDQRERQQRDDLSLLKTKALEIKQDQRLLEQSRALSRASQQLVANEQALTTLQSRQQRLQRRSGQFKELHQELESLQNDTAEIVLGNIRRPVSTVFQAMTAGCPWDIEFRLEDGKVNAVLTDGSAHDVAATSVLNSAYVNVAAIALRLALASQQRWTRLRTVVLDDPILEMDHLTQSALIDGLEAVLASSFAPWHDLQFVLTTWSEDFAVMAAHKLAHLNHESVDDFVIHRLSSDLDGTIVSQRHVPRWRKEANAA
jgi:AAA domain